jgi:flagellar FliJ protein
MKPFKFRLQKLLEFREMEEEQNQLAFGRVQAEYKFALDELQRLIQQRDTAVDLFCKKQKNGLKIEEFKLFQNYFDKFNEDIQNQRQKIEKIQAILHEKQKLLIEAVQKRKIVEKFKEKRFNQYYSQQLQDEQKMIDEVGTQAFVRKKAGT